MGAVETSATDSRVTDSAASATAYACGIKTYNGAIGVDTTGAPCRTILERAATAGLGTGLVATSRITHATPATYAAHVRQRSHEDVIARQMPASGVDLLMGGGLAGSRGGVSNDLLVQAEAGGWTVVTRPRGLRRPRHDARDGAPGPGPHGLRDRPRPGRPSPSLAEMTRRALDLLDARDERAASS